MEFLKEICEWFIRCFKAVPDAIVTGIYSSLIFLLIRLIINRVVIYSDKIRSLAHRLKEIWNSQPEINDSYLIIPSPNYNINTKRMGNDLFKNNEGGTLLLLCIFGVAGTIWLRENHEKVQAVFYFSCIIFMGLSIFFVILSTFRNRIQSSTLKFSIFGTIISMYIIYSANVLPKLILKIPNDFSIINLFLEPNEYWPGFYVFFGLIVVVIEIILIALMLIRTVVIKIDDFRSVYFTKWVIYKTKRFDSIKGMIIVFIVLTIMSYLMTSDIIIEFVLKS